MTPETRRMMGNVVLFVAAAALIVQVCGMAGWIPKLLPSREMAPMVMMLVFVSLVLRRRRAAGHSDPS